MTLADNLREKQTNCVQSVFAGRSVIRTIRSWNHFVRAMIVLNRIHTQTPANSTSLNVPPSRSEVLAWLRPVFCCTTRRRGKVAIRTIHCHGRCRCLATQRTKTRPIHLPIQTEPKPCRKCLMALHNVLTSFWNICSQAKKKHKSSETIVTLTLVVALRLTVYAWNNTFSLHLKSPRLKFARSPRQEQHELILEAAWNLTGFAV